MGIKSERAATFLISMASVVTLMISIIWLVYIFSIKGYIVKDAKENMRGIASLVQYSALNGSGKFEQLHTFCRDKNFTVRLISLEPLNIANLAEEEDAVALSLFSKGLGEYFTIYKERNKTFIKLLCPIFYNGSCLKCHRQSESLFPGAVSVIFDMTYTESRSETLGTVALIAFIITLVMALMISFVYGRKKIRDLRMLSSDIEKFRYIDDVTLFYNRTFFLKRLGEEFERSRRYRSNLSLMIISLDLLSDGTTLSQNKKTEILKSSAEIIKSHCRDSDIYGRYSDNAFAIIIPEATREGVSIMADKVMKKILAKEGSSEVMVSIGIAFMNFEEAYSPEILLYDAEAALSRAIEHRENRIEFS